MGTIRTLLLAAEAVQHAPAQGILRRDIEPGNLLLDHQGKLGITPSGQARLGVDAGITMAGDLLVTPHDMSPESIGMNRLGPSSLLGIRRQFDRETRFCRYSGNSITEYKPMLSLDRMRVRLLVALAMMIDTEPEPRDTHAQAVDPAARRLIRVTGQSYVAAPGRQWEHEVTRSWQGYVRVLNANAEGLEMLDQGRERLTWQTQEPSLKEQPAAAHLMAGHAIDLESDVIYGLTANAR
jgi:hypothetical protein